eukprot:7207494-Prymnesium_polylepis.1
MVSHESSTSSAEPCGRRSSVRPRRCNAEGNRSNGISYPVVAVEVVVLPRVGRWRDAYTLVQPRGHRRELLGHRVRARAVDRVCPADGGHKVANDAVKERGVPVGRRPGRRAVGRGQLGHGDARVRVPRREANKLGTKV